MDVYLLGLFVDGCDIHLVRCGVLATLAGSSSHFLGHGGQLESVILIFPVFFLVLGF